ncbi:transmembrane protein, putative [Medicago truncatula]|uniref:Transmembrane protein, putative n=1 Tax=Medicago truncatula TaxID=3880 RepID=G8A2U7_MEDTR|nr:transmembrane protein, putative [Medicago truncatula]
MEHRTSSSKFWAYNIVQQTLWGLCENITLMVGVFWKTRMRRKEREQKDKSMTLVLSAFYEILE